MKHHISAVQGKDGYEVWDFTEKRLLKTFDKVEDAAAYATEIQGIYKSTDPTVAKAFRGDLNAIPWSIEYSGEQYGWVIEDAAGRFIASVNTRENAVAIRKAMKADEKPKHEYAEMLDGLVEETTLKLP